MEKNSIYKSEAGRRMLMALYDAALSRWSPQRDTLVLPTRHGETFAIACGDPSAPPLVLLHGAASNAVSWVGDVPAYSQYFRVYAVDLPGEPGRSSQNRPSWQGLAFAEWLEDVLDSLEILQTSLLGISQGGWTALRFATSYPQRVEKLVLLAPSGIVPTRRSFIVRALLLSALGRRGVEALNRSIFGGQPIHPEALKFMNAIMTHFKARLEKEYLFTDEELSRLAMPIFLLGGRKDIIQDVEKGAERLGRLVPSLTSVILPAAGHALVSMPERILPFLLVR